MLVEVNDLRHLVIHVPGGNLSQAAEWLTLASAVRSVLLVDRTELATWAGLASGSNTIVEPWGARIYLAPARGHLRAALDTLGAEPHDVGYATTDPSEIREAANVRVGTILIGEPDACLPDIVAESPADALDRIKRLIAGTVPGYYGEVVATVNERGFRPAVVGWLVTLRRPQFAGIEAASSVLALGRYFSTADARSVKHQLTQRILRIKRDRPNDDQVLQALLASAIEWVESERHIDAIARVPRRPGAVGADNLGELIRRAHGIAGRAGSTVVATYDRGVLECPGDYPRQRDAGGAMARAENVRGVFRVGPPQVSGHVLLIDDVITTGSTLGECSRKLLDAGAEFVTALALGADQTYVLDTPRRRLTCPRVGCDGSMVLRFDSKARAAFWGCREYIHGCRETRPWLVGLTALNRSNTRVQGGTELDIAF